MRSDPEFQLFLKKWRDAFRAPSDTWEGPRAVADLKSARYTRSSRGENADRSLLKFVQAEQDYGPRPWDMLEGIFGEVKDYKEQKLVWKKESRDTDLFLSSEVRRITRRRSKVVDPILKSLLVTTAEMIEQGRLALRNSTKPTHHSPLGVWERLWAHHARSEDIKRGIDLDTRLQFQSAKMLRTFLHQDDGVSRRTIARLVVLVYLVAGLASEGNDGSLWVADSERPITVRQVEDKLQARGFR